MQPALIQKLVLQRIIQEIFRFFKKFKITEYRMIVNILRIYSKTVVL